MDRPIVLTILLGAAVFVAGCTAGNDRADHSASDLKAQALALQTSKPFDTTTPAHTWHTTGDGRMTFLHWDHDDPTKATGLLFTGEGFQGAFCAGPAGVTEEEYDAGFVHFHSAKAANWDAGHNAGGADGAPTTEGWWLRHVGAGDMTMSMMGEEMKIEKGKVFHLMPAGFDDLEPCAAHVGHGDLHAQLRALYTSTPFATTADKSPHHTPEHSWLETGDGRLLFLHWDHADPASAAGLLFTGDGIRGKFCAGEAGITRAEYDAGFVHFHTATAPNWDAGHNAGGADGAPTTEGWWLRHIGAGDMTMRMMGMDMVIQKGEVFPLMPAGFDDLATCGA